MNKYWLNLALAAVVLAASSVFGAACSGGGDDDDDDGFSPEVVLQEDGGAADFTSCTAGSASTTDVNILVQVGIQPLSGDPDPAEGAEVRLYDPATGTEDADITTLDAAGEGIITVPNNSRVAYKITLAPNGTTTYTDTYEFNHETPATSDTAGGPATTLRIVPQGIADAFIQILGYSASELAGTMSVAGGVNDCSGESVENARVTFGAAPLCDDADGTFPCIAYLRGTPSLTARDTDGSGQFVVIGVPPGPQTIDVVGLLTEGGTDATIGTVPIRGVADAIGIAISVPQNAP